MRNSLEAYAHCGRVAGLAMRQGDISMYRLKSGHFRMMLDVERREDRPAAESAYKRAYSAIARPFIISG
jgi:hypothetical protein